MNCPLTTVLVRHEPPFPIVTHELRRRLVGELEEFFWIAVPMWDEGARYVATQPAFIATSLHKSQSTATPAICDILYDAQGLFS